MPKGMSLLLENTYSFQQQNTLDVVFFQPKICPSVTTIYASTHP